MAIAAEPAATITEEVSIADAQPWWRGALAELQANLAAQGVPTTGAAGALLSDELFSAERGVITVFVPCSPTLAPIGRSEPAVIPATELAVLDHDGSHADIDLTYGAPADYVSRGALAVDDPIREYYVQGPHNGAAESAWRTSIGWPIFRTSTRADR